MRLDHLLLPSVPGTLLADEQRLKLMSLLKSFGFMPSKEGFELDETFPWVTLSEIENGFHVTVRLPLPDHLFDPAMEALEALVREVGLVRVDPLTRGLMNPSEWSRRVSESSKSTFRKGFP